MERTYRRQSILRRKPPFSGSLRLIIQLFAQLHRRSDASAKSENHQFYADRESEKCACHYPLRVHSVANECSDIFFLALCLLTVSAMGCAASHTAMPAAQNA